MRIRTIKPEFFKHEDLYDAELETGLPLRLAFAGLWCAADREGRFKWQPRALKSDILPFDDLDFSRVLDALSTRGFVVKYASESREYGWIPGFTRHQVINNRERESELPEPTDAAIEAALTRAPRVGDACPTRLVHAQAEHGREHGTGNKEGNKDSTPLSPPVGTGVVLENAKPVDPVETGELFPDVPTKPKRKSSPKKGIDYAPPKDPRLERLARAYMPRAARVKPEEEYTWGRLQPNNEDVEMVIEYVEAWRQGKIREDHELHKFCSQGISGCLKHWDHQVRRAQQYRKLGESIAPPVSHRLDAKPKRFAGDF